MLHFLRDTIEGLKNSRCLCKDGKVFIKFITFQARAKAVPDMSRECDGWKKSLFRKDIKERLDMKQRRQLFMFFAGALLIFCNFSLPYAFTLPATGQTTCYDTNGNVIACTGTGQDAAHIVNPMSYTDNGNGTVTDNVTGLMWQMQDDSNTYNWYQASGTYDATNNPTSQNVCGMLRLAGYSDWRLPAVMELASIADYGIPYPEPTINTTYFPNTRLADYWSSATWAEDAVFAWYVCYLFGDIGISDKSYGDYVRCVRGGQESASLTGNGNGTVTDNSTGLMWQQAEGGSKTWTDALSYCNNLSLAGNSDWRLPNVKELTSIVDYTRGGPSINTAAFPNANAFSYWSSTTFTYYAGYAWPVDFDNGFVNNYVNVNSPASDDYYVRCVRSVQSGSSGNVTLTVSKAGTGNGTVTANSGTISWSDSTGTASYSSGTSVTLTAAASSGSTFTSWTSCDSTNGNTCTVSMTTAKSVIATFALNAYTVIPSAGANGSLSPSFAQSVNYNSATSFTVTPNTGYSISSVTGCGGTLSGNTYRTGPITGPCTVAASFAVNTFTVTPSTDNNGSLTPSNAQPVNYSSTTSFMVTPNTGYQISSVTGCGGTLFGNTFTTGPITGNCTVSATFAVNTYTVTPSTDNNGSLTPSTAQSVNYNSTTSFTVTPNTGYQIASVTGCGGTLSGNTYTTGPLTGQCTVAASFSLNTYTVTATAATTAGVSGSLSPSGVTTVNYGGSQTYTITPTAGYAAYTVLVDGNPVGAATTYTFNDVTANHTITAIFGFTNIAAGLYHTVALKSDGTLWAWGDNSSGELGDGTTNNQSSPEQIGTDNKWVSVATVLEHTVALKSDGTLWAWGNNADGQLGDGTTNSQTSPEQIGSDNNWVSVAAGYNHTVALKSDNTLWAWGNNITGQLGDGTTNNQSSPEQIGADNNWASIAAGEGHTVALKSDGTVWTSGDNVYGDLGDGTTTQHNSLEQIALINSYTVTPSAGDNGGLSPSTAQSVTYNSSTSFTVTPNTGYQIALVTGCGGTLSGNTYTTSAITGNCTVSASFVALPPPATAVTLTANPQSPQQPGTQVTFTAAASGGSGNYQYYFTVYNPNTGIWTPNVPVYSSNASWTWNTTGLGAGKYLVQVWARSVGSTAKYDTWTEVTYTLIAPPPPATGVTLTINQQSPQQPGAQVTFTAAASGGSGSYQYYFTVLNPNTGTWSVGQAYSSNASWTWNTAGLGTGKYIVQAWARSVGSTATYDAWTGVNFTLDAPPAPATGVTLTMNQQSPQSPGVQVTFTAAASGGSGSYQYYYTVFNPNTGTWSVGQAYGSNASWTWNTTGLGTGAYTIQVWARSVGSIAAYDTWTGVKYTLVVPQPPATAVTLTVNPQSPQSPGAQITFTAAASGGSGSYQYYFTVLNPNTGSWSVGQAYSSNASWTWDTTGLGAGNYQVQVWARSAGSTAAYEAWTGVKFTLN